MSQNETWSLYNCQTEDRLIDLSEEAARLHLQRLSKEQLGDWFAWQIGMSDWRPVLEIAALMMPQLPKASPAVPPPVPPVRPVQVAEAPAFIERRQFPRFEIRLRVVIVSENGSAFRSMTRDLSEGGMQVEHEIPDSLVNCNCEFYLSNGKGGDNLRFSGRVLQSSPDRRRIQFQAVDQNLKARINALRENLCGSSQEANREQTTATLLKLQKPAA